MRALFLTGNRTVELRHVPDPVPGDGEVVVKIETAGICGSDVHFYRAPSEYLDTQIVAGHEPAGVVCRVGKCVRNIQVGDRVSVFHYRSCGACEYCRRGEKMFCDDARGMGWKTHGPDADYLLVDAQNCLPLPAELTYVDGSFLACTGGTAYAVLKRLRPFGKEKLAVFGLGPVGLSVCLLAKKMGLEVVGLDLVSERLELAKNLGVESVVDVTESNPVDTLSRLTGDRGVEAIAETSGSSAAVRAAIEVASIRGRIALVGLTGIVGPEASATIELVPRPLITKAVSLLGSCLLSEVEYYEAVDFMVQKHVHFDSLVTHTFALEDGIQAFRVADSGKAGKVMLVP